MILDRNLKIAIQAAVSAGKEIMKVYEKENFEIESKEDNSPLTIADKKSNDILNKFLIPTRIPIISEENNQINYTVRKEWNKCWIVDPLDGTKEFIKRNGEFTVNVALISHGTPKLGVIYAPALNNLYFADVAEGKAYKVSLAHEDLNIKSILERTEEIKPLTNGDCIKVVGSRSHMNKETLQYIEELRDKYGKEIEVVSKGSSLKFCLVAEGKAQVYPRLAPTMEWDTAAGQAICEAVGLKCTFTRTGEPVTYNREELTNDHFIVSH